MKYFILILFSAVLLSCSTTGSEPNLEEISVDLNGNVLAFVNEAEWNSGPNNSARINYNENRIMIEGFLEEDGIIRSHITLIIDNVEQDGYVAPEATGIYYEVASNNTFISNNDCTVDITKLDLVNNAISGRFSFTGINVETKVTRLINSGEFTDVNLSITE